VVRQSLDEPSPEFPLIKTAVPSWDNDARRQGAGLVILGSTPAKYHAWLSTLVARARQAPVLDESLVCINAWNEWCEAAYLEPDLHFGSAYLNATARAVVGLASGEAAPYGLLLIGHDAFPSGAQQLLLNIGRVLKRRHGLRIEFLLLDGGQLEAAYRAEAPTKVLVGSVGLGAALADLAARGFTRALVNTSAASSAVPALEAAGIFPSLMLVHELPRIMREKHLIEGMQRALLHVRRIVFPAHFVQAAVTAALGKAPDEAFVLPQGSYKILSPTAEKIAAFRARLGISKGEPLMLGAGYADMRKGFDLFLQVWRLMNRERRVHFCWAGLLAPELDGGVAEEIAAAKASGTFHLPGLIEDVAPAFGAATAFLLTSREDPFPTVALEALSVGKLVIAFADSGGIPEMLQETGAGIVVPYGDSGAMATALERLLDQPEAPAKAKARKALVRKNYTFAPYVTDLLGLALPEIPRISVAVPNYNYASYMPERLSSIFRQSHMVHEVLVLDDHSKDDSVEIIGQVATEWDREIHLIVNEVNSGSVFAQWRKAAEMAKGDWLWIAEADDTSDPEFLARLMVAVGGDPGVVMAFSDSRTIHADGSPQWESYKDYYATMEPQALARTEVFDGLEFVSRFLSVKNLILNVSAVVWRRDVLLHCLDACWENLATLRMAGDWRLYLEALSRPGARIAYEAKPLNVHRRHAQSVTHALAAELHLDEIARCHALARTTFELPELTYARQDAYVAEVRKQFTIAETAIPVAGPGQAAEEGSKNRKRGTRRKNQR
jgi:glycosyltransferase involved in cell wall biosynthesis